MKNLKRESTIVALYMGGVMYSLVIAFLWLIPVIIGEPAPYTLEVIGGSIIIFLLSLWGLSRKLMCR